MKYLGCAFVALVQEPKPAKVFGMPVIPSPRSWMFLGGQYMLQLLLVNQLFLSLGFHDTGDLYLLTLTFYKVL